MCVTTSLGIYTGPMLEYPPPNAHVKITILTSEGMEFGPNIMSKDTQPSNFSKNGF